MRQEVKSFDEVVSTSDDDFTISGLSDSLIRLGFLAMLPSAKIAGSIGAISSERHERLLKSLADYLMKGARR